MMWHCGRKLRAFLGRTIRFTTLLWGHILARLMMCISRPGVAKATNFPSGERTGLLRAVQTVLRGLFLRLGSATYLVQFEALGLSGPLAQAQTWSAATRGRLAAVTLELARQRISYSKVLGA